MRDPDLGLRTRLAPRYEVDETESASTLVLTAMIVVLPVAIALTD